MTNWTDEQKKAHRYNPNNLQCFMAAITGSIKDIYPQYFMVKYTEITCKNCGAWKDSYKEDLYECDGFGNPLNESDTVKATQSTKTNNNVAITESEDDMIVDNTDIIDSDEIITDEPVISDNSVVSENMIETE